MLGFFDLIDFIVNSFDLYLRDTVTLLGLSFPNIYIFPLPKIAISSISKSNLTSSARWHLLRSVEYKERIWIPFPALNLTFQPYLEYLASTKGIFLQLPSYASSTLFYQHIWNCECTAVHTQDYYHAILYFMFFLRDKIKFELFALAKGWFRLGRRFCRSRWLLGRIGISRQYGM